jgi:methyl-accepting chemotaxis protein
MLLLSASAFIGILLIAAISMFMMREVGIGGTTYTFIQKNKDALEGIALLKSDLFQINGEIQNFMLEADAGTAQKNITTIKNLTNDIELNFGIVLDSVESPLKRDAINKVEAIWKAYRATLLNDVLPAAVSGDVLKASYLMTSIQAERFSSFSMAVARMVSIIHSDVKATEEQVAADIRIKIAISSAVTLVVIGLIALLSFYITTSITAPLSACVTFAQDVAGGKLDARLEVRGGGETADLAAAMNSMAESLHSMVSRISSASEILTKIDTTIETSARQVVSSAQKQEGFVREASQSVIRIDQSVREVAAGVETLSSAAAETSSSTLEMAATIEEVALSAENLEQAVEEVSSSIIEMASSLKAIGESIVNLLDASSTTASSVAEMDATIKQVEKNAMASAAISESVRSDAETGKKAVLETIAGMQAILAASKITAEVVVNLSLKVHNIGTILSVIDEVADQTNLLALNAAIIAAQAGEHGKGFAVVADEIRELAERTSSSTREIAVVIKGVQEETGRAVVAITQTEGSIAEGEKLSQRSGAALEKIVSGAQRAGVQASEIAKATVEQAHGSQNIRNAMESIAEMVGYIATSAQEHSHGTEMITSAVERMKELTVHVRTSTREQSRASSLIAKSTEDVTAMVDQIRDACRSQEQSCAMISKSVDNIQGVTSANSTTAKVMDASVADLTRQIDLLEKEMAGFTI